MKKPVRKLDKSERKRLRVVYKGRVQGVGFRFTVESIAMDAGVTGWVRNLGNGDVELVAEGSEKAIQTMLDEIQNSILGRYVDQTVIRWDDYQGEFSDFRIEYIY